MSAFNMFQDLPSIEFGIDDAPWTHVHSDRLRSDWSSAIINCSSRNTNHFRMDPFSGFDLHMQTEASYYMPSEYELAPPRNNGLGLQPSYKHDYFGNQVKYDGIAPWAPSVRKSEYISPGSCVDERMASEQGSWSDGSTWSPGPSESHTEIELEDSRTSHSYHAACYSPGTGRTPSFTDSCQSPRVSDSLHGESIHPGPGVTLQDVQQYPDIYQEDALDNAARFDCKGFYRYSSASEKPAELNKGKLGTASPSPTEITMTSLRKEEELAIKDESMSDVENESSSDYSPARRKKPSASHSIQKGKRSTSPARRTNKISSRTKTRGTVSGVRKRSPRAPDIKAGASFASGNSATAICTHCKEILSSKAALSKHISTIHTRPFTCTFRLYGCPATFGSKNEWKRHVSSQHLRLGIWRCDLGACLPPSPNHGEVEDPEPIYNEFNRKDLFTQHLRRMHSPSTSCSQHEKDHFAASLETACMRCLIDIRSPPPYSSCGYCPAGQQGTVFEGLGLWEARMEHVGRHLESGHGEEKQWVEDTVLRDWMVAEGLVERVGGRELRLVGLQVEEGKSKRVKN
ncbi:hypothetical protein MMC17_009989 [Xylographa soralifera]|nr:hypothetical protein [Xylographa soralifera]